MIKRLIKILNKTDKQAFFFVLILSIVISFIEVIGVSAIMPFISMASNFGIVQANQYYSALYNLLGFDKPIEFIILIGVLLLLFYFSRAVANAYYFYRLSKLSEGQYERLANRLFKHILQLKSSHFITKNSAILTKTIVNEASHMTQVISAILLMLSESFILLFLYALLLFVNWKVTLVFSLVTLFIVFFMLKKITLLIKTEGVQREKAQQRLFHELNNSFGNFKLIKLFAVENQRVKIFSDISNDYVKTNILFQSTSHLPRLILDFLGFGSLITIILLLLHTQQTDISTSIPILSLYVVALYRLLPSINRIITNYNKVMFYQRSLDTIEEVLNGEEEHLGDQPITFKQTLTFAKVHYAYSSEHSPVFRGLNFTLKKSERIAILGESGSGKSTFIDLVMGLNTPTSGQILIDNEVLTSKTVSSWRQKIGYIPQHIYLFDDSVANNIVFGRSYDEAKIKHVLTLASMMDFLESKQGIHTLVGEDGKLLSGGQKQRIAIARALYGDPEILIMDEATSALDKSTQETIMQEIYALPRKMTMIIITHDPAITKGCDSVYEIKEQTLREVKA